MLITTKATCRQGSTIVHHIAPDGTRRRLCVTTYGGSSITTKGIWIPASMIPHRANETEQHRPSLHRGVMFVPRRKGYDLLRATWTWIEAPSPHAIFTYLSFQVSNSDVPYYFDNGKVISNKSNNGYLIPSHAHYTK